MEPEIIEVKSFTWKCPLCGYSSPEGRPSKEAAKSAYKAHENTTYHQSMRSGRKNL